MHLWLWIHILCYSIYCVAYAVYWATNMLYTLTDRWTSKYRKHNNIIRTEILWIFNWFLNSDSKHDYRSWNCFNGRSMKQFTGSVEIFLCINWVSKKYRRQRAKLFFLSFNIYTTDNETISWLLLALKEKNTYSDVGMWAGNTFCRFTLTFPQAGLVNFRIFECL